MAQQSILGRIGQLARANINAMIDAAEDPEKMLDQMVRDYTTNIAEAEDAVAQTIGNLRMLEEDHQEALENAREWGVKALAASRKGDELRAAGDTAGADRQAERAGGSGQDGRGPDPGPRRGSQHRPHGSHQRSVPLRGQGPP